MEQVFGIDTKSSLLPPNRIHDASVEYDVKFDVNNRETQQHELIVIGWVE